MCVECVFQSLREGRVGGRVALGFAHKMSPPFTISTSGKRRLFQNEDLTRSSIHGALKIRYLKLNIIENLQGSGRKRFSQIFIFAQNWKPSLSLKTPSHFINLRVCIQDRQVCASVWRTKDNFLKLLLNLYLVWAQVYILRQARWLMSF